MLDLVCIAIILICVVIGAKRGFVKTVMGFVSLILSIFLGVTLYNPFVNLMMSVPFMADILEGIKTSIANTVKPTITAAVDGNMPEYLSKLISPEMLTSGADAIAAAAAETVFAVILVIIFIIVIKIGIALIMGMLGIMTKVPVIKQLNQVLGGAAGLLIGLVLCYITAAIVFIVAAYGGGDVLYEGVQTSFIAKYFIDNNIIINMIK